jgi:reductive dehalogenase
MLGKKLSRRDFLKLGGLATMSLPTITRIGKVDGYSLLESEEAFGGFLVKQIEDGEEPIEVDEAIYKRFDPKYTIFSREIWDDEYNEVLSKVEKNYQFSDPGYSHIDIAISEAGGFCAGFAGTTSGMGAGIHAGMLSLTPEVLVKSNISLEGKWDHNSLSPEGVSGVVKSAAKFIGASLAGIAPMNERWIYTQSFDPFTGDISPIEITEVEEVILPEGKVSQEEAKELIKAEMEKISGEEIKTIVVEVLENANPSDLPPDAPPLSLVKVIPGSKYPEQIHLFIAMPAPILQEIAKKLGLGFEIAEVDLGESARPRYLEDGTLAIPETMKTVIVLAFEMDSVLMDAAPTALADLSTAFGYSNMAATTAMLAQFIRKLGYHAIPCGNNTAITVPQAVEAGLGEGGRNGILITPKYGPRVRLSKIITDLPMAFDKPIKFGVEEFCEVCGKCAEHCPTQAITYGEKSMEPTTISTNPGVKKWSVNAENCYKSWAAHASGCSMCIKVCPFNKPEGWLHDATRILIGAKSGALDKLLVNLDDASGYGPEPKFNFWDHG